ncbi:MAG TPA: polymer-forming cytoskeletal protein [Acidimicrobiia bacterium]
MRYLSRQVLVAAGVCAALLAVALPATAAETSNSEIVIIQADDVFPEDLYAGAIRVVVDGTLDGDLVAFAAEEVVITGTVTGSVTAVAPSVTVEGEVEGSLRVSGRRLGIDGSVGRDVVTAAVNVVLGRDSDVAGDVLIWGWDVAVLGAVGGDVLGTQRNLELAGSVAGDVDVVVSRLDVVAALNVGGDFGYRSGNEADGLDRVTSQGAIVSKEPLPPNIRVRALSLLGRFMVILFLSIAALTTAYGWPGRTSRAISEVGRAPIRRWLAGAPIVFAPLLAVGLTALIVGLAPAAAAFPLLLVLIPLILALSGLSFALALVAGAPVVGWLGGVIFKRFELYGAILAGSIVVGLVWYLPWLGWLVPLLVLPLGLGAWFATWRQEATVSLAG